MADPVKVEAHTEQQGLRLVLFALPAVAVLLIAFFWSKVIRSAFGGLLANLPLTLPVLSVAMAVFLDPRGLRRLHGWFRLTSPIALGLVSFAIWYFVASQGATDYIRVSSSKVLKKDYALLLVIVSFIWAGFCSVVAIIAERVDQARHSAWTRLRFGTFALSVAFLLLPFALFQGKAEVEREIGASLDVKTFAVSIPYRDPALNLYLGRSTSPLTQALIYFDVRAKTPSEAVESAVARFRSSDVNWQFRLPNRRSTPDSVRRPVEIMDASIVAQERH